MGMNLTNVSDARGLVVLGLDALPVGAVIETREQSGGWRLYLRESDDATGWAVMATSRDIDVNPQAPNRLVTADIVAAAVIDSAAVATLLPEWAANDAAENDGPSDDLAEVVHAWAKEEPLVRSHAAARNRLIRRLAPLVPAEPTTLALEWNVLVEDWADANLGKDRPTSLRDLVKRIEANL